jgi:hypothetical protein
MLEGYFVRTLGMHRVYNSAFMHMLRNEDNAKYRDAIKNTLEFDPQVLKRYVNFMNNPDEKTAIEQFGNGDKYFGVATLMATLPGLPMIGHGQIEGFHEKYGMEYRRAYWDEYPDEGLIEHHNRVIFPLLRRRYLFAEIDHFLLYDVISPEGSVNEDIFAYSNGSGDERALIVYHNKFSDARGWIKMSAAYLDKSNGTMRQRSLGEGLKLRGEDRDYVIFRDVTGGLDYIRPCRDLVTNGFYVELGAYQCHSFVEFKEVFDGDGKWKEVNDSLNGAGYWAIQARWDELFTPKVIEEQPVVLPTQKKVKTRKPTKKKPSTEKVTSVKLTKSTPRAKSKKLEKINTVE